MAGGLRGLQCSDGGVGCGGDCGAVLVFGELES